MKKVFYFIVSLAFLSCEKEADVKVPATNPKLVLFSFLSNENAQQTAFVSWSAPVIGSNQELKIEPNANVYLVDESGVKVSFAFNQIMSFYVSPMNAISIEPGKTYTVVAVLGKDSVWGTTKIPLQAVKIDEYGMSKVPSPFEGEEKRRFTCKWTDIVNQENYYRITLDPKLDFPTDGLDEMYNGFYSDRQKDGETFATSFEINTYNPPGSQSKYTLNLLTCDYPYYEYHRRRVNYFGDDPFSEPSPMYTNVKGGLGVVGSYLKSSVVIND
ncbi:MAG: DUF4249 domain-containing protein [Bacteroidia bacterium]|nr:DUF4249 domain-containing protein [Bacteroidia bacterium]